MLEIGSWLYVFSTIPILLFLVLIPYWLRDFGVSVWLKALAGYVFSTAILVVTTVVFIWFYAGCFENCYATKKDEMAMTISTLFIALHLMFFFRRCQSYNKKRNEVDGASGP